MKKTLIVLFLFSAAVVIQSCSSTTKLVVSNTPVISTPSVTAVVSTPAVNNPTAPAPVATNPTTPQIVNLQNAMPGPINLENQATMDALNNDPMLNSNPLITNNNSGLLSGSAEANIINAGASFDNIDQQVNDDINSSSSTIDSGNAGTSKISDELEAKDIRNLSVPGQN